MCKLTGIYLCENSLQVQTMWLNLPCIATRFYARLRLATPRHSIYNIRYNICSALGLHNRSLFHRAVKLYNAKVEYLNKWKRNYLFKPDRNVVA